MVDLQMVSLLLLPGVFCLARLYGCTGNGVGIFHSVPPQQCLQELTTTNCDRALICTFSDFAQQIVYKHIAGDIEEEAGKK